MMSPLFRVSDLEMAHEIIAEKICPHKINIIEDPDKLDVDFSGMLRKDLQLLNISYGAHVDINPTENQNYYFAQSTLNGTSCVYRKQQIVPTKVGETVIVSPNTRYNFVLPTATRRLVLAVEREIMTDYLQSLLEQPLNNQLHFDLHVPDQKVLQIWGNHIFNLSQTLMTQPILATNRKLFQSQLESTMSLMLTLFQHNYSESLNQKDDSATPQRIKTAKEYIQQNIKEPISVLEVAKAVGLSPRALQYAFRQELNISPLQYIKYQKIKAIHDALKAADPFAKVTSILYDHGITSHGHFSKRYKQLYLSLIHI